MSAERVELVGAQPSDPAWARLLFVLVEGRDGQWWRGFLLVALTGLLGVGLVGALALTGWVGGLLGVGVGSLTAAAFARRRRQTSLSSQRASQGTAGRIGPPGAGTADLDTDPV